MFLACKIWTMSWSIVMVVSVSVMEWFKLSFMSWSEELQESRVLKVKDLKVESGSLFRLLIVCSLVWRSFVKLVWVILRSSSLTCSWCSILVTIDCIFLLASSFWIKVVVLVSILSFVLILFDMISDVACYIVTKMWLVGVIYDAYIL